MNRTYLTLILLVAVFGGVSPLQQVRPPGRRISKPTSADTSSSDGAGVSPPLPSSPSSKCPLSKFHTWLTSFVELSSETFESKYSDAAKHIKCPFIRRRISDGIDQSATVMAFILSRHKSLAIIPAPQIPGQKSMHGPKSRGMSLDAVWEFIKDDWKASEKDGKGYYITGKLSTHLYRDDCYFDGPDPDMPVRGLRKYQSAASQLFDRKVSRADILGSFIDEDEQSITVRWRLEGVLNLPWHPTMKPWTGSTTYYLDEDHLICRHIEKWDISAIDAFVSLLFPSFRIGAPPAARPDFMVGNRDTYESG